MNRVSAADVPQALRLAPRLVARPWGGDRLRQMMGKGVVRNAAASEGPEPIGEAWELSDHPAGRSTIAEGPLAGLTFGEALRRYPRALCGLPAAPDRYPLLIKWIDAAQDLSLQEHPDGAQAAGTGDRGKHECWYIVDCRPGTTLIHGLATGMDADALQRALAAGDPGPCLRRLAIRPGDFLEVPPGTVHAIPAGTLLCEVQQCSDLTYRLWDWGRRPPRPLHVEEALRTVRSARSTPIETRRAETTDGWTTLLQNAVFDVRLGVWEPATDRESCLPNPHGLAVCIVEGEGWMELPGGARYPLVFGQTWFLAAGIERWRAGAGARGLRVLAARSLEL